MRFSLFTPLLALSGLSIASPVVAKRADTLSLLNDLYATVQIYTGAINATLAPLSASSSALEKAAAAPEVGKQISLITAAVTSTTNEISALTPSEKRSTISVNALEAPEKRQDVAIAVAAILALIIVEILATVTAAVLVLGGALLVVFTTPLTTSLPLLVLAVQAELNVVLGGVTVILNTLLTSLAVALAAILNP